MHTKNNKEDEIKQERKRNSALSKSKTLSLCNKPSIEELEKTLYTLKSSLPHQNSKILDLLSMLPFLSTFEKATPLQKQWLSLVINLGRKNIKDKKHMFRVANSIASRHLGCCEKTCQRASAYWAEHGAIIKRLIRVSWDRTVNNLSIQGTAVDFNLVFVGDQVKINYHDKMGTRQFVPLLEYVAYRTRELLRLEEKRQKKVGSFFSAPRKCPPDKSVYINISKSTTDISKEIGLLKEDYIYDSMLTEGILCEGYRCLALEPYELSQFRRFDEEIVLTCIQAISKLQVDKLISIKNLVGYLYRCCQNLTKGYTPWPTRNMTRRKKETTSSKPPQLEHSSVVYRMMVDPIPSGIFSMCFRSLD